MTTHTCSVKVSAASCYPSTITYSHCCEKRNSVSSTSEVPLTSLERMCRSWWRGGCWEKSGGVMCGWMEIISQTLQGVVLPSQRWLLGNSIFQNLFFFWVVTGLPHLTHDSVLVPVPPPPTPLPSCWWLTCTSFGWAPASHHRWQGLRGYTSSSSRVPMLWCCSGGPAMGLLHMGQTQRTSSHFTRHLWRWTWTGEAWKG